MDLLNESAAVNELAHIIVKGSAELFNSVKYIYSIADSSFYSVDIRDAFRIIFESGADMLPSLGLSATKAFVPRWQAMSTTRCLCLWRTALRCAYLC